MDFFSGLLQTALLLSLFLITGFCLLFFKGNFKNIRISFTTIFLSLFTGISVVVSVYSIVICKGKSIHIVLLPALLYLIFIIRNSEMMKKSVDYKIWYPLLVLVSACLFFYSYCYFGYGNYYNNMDYVYYSKISYYLPKTGFENDYHIFNTLDSDYNAVTPYHYFDLWLNAINHFVIPLKNSLDTFLLVTPAILLATVFFGFLSVYETHKKMDGYGFLLSIIIIFFGGIFIPLKGSLSFLNQFMYCYDPYSVQNIAKYTPTVIYIIAGYVLLKNVSLFSGMMFLSLIGVISIVNVPASGFAAVIVFLFFSIFKPKSNLSVRQYGFILLPVFLIALFYIVLGNKQIARGGTDAAGLSELFKNLVSLPFLLQKINIVAGSALSILTVYLFLIPAVYYVFFRKNNFQNNTADSLFIIWLIAACAGGLIAWSFMSPKINAVQPFYHVLKALPVLIFITVMYFEKPVWKYLFFVLITVFSAFHFYKAITENLKNKSKSDYQAIYKLNAEYFDLKNNVAVIKDSSQYNSTSSYYSTCYSSGIYFYSNIDPMFPINISDYNTPVVTDKITGQINFEAVKLGLFYRFVDKQKKDQTFISLEESQWLFIQKYNIKTIILSPKAISPSFVTKYADTTILIPGWNEKIVRLKY